MSLKVINSVDELRQYIKQYKYQQCIGFVPTMGNLHQGHIDLVDCARKKADIVVVSIFVNPMQFGAGEDLDNYPRTMAEDIEKLTVAKADILFAPNVSEIYGDNLSNSTQVIVPDISKRWCGASRPGHFDGVTTVVNKLFNLVQPDVAVFGEKDFQQLAIIRKMVADLNMPVEIIGVATRRETDGLAMSSRNGYLSENEREIAPKLREILLNIEKKIVNEKRPDYEIIIEQAQSELNATGLKTDYLAICRQSDLMPALPADQQLVVLAAVFLGKTRLIDNLTINLGE